MSDSLQIFTDGSFDVSSRSGGWAFVVMDGEREVHSESGFASAPSNNALEVLAVVKALAWIANEAVERTVTLFTDSNHVVEGCQRWRAIWRNNGWKRIDANPRSRRRPIPDAALWQQVDAMLELSPGVTVKLCKGHAGIAGNERADALAREAARVV